MTSLRDKYIVEVAPAAAAKNGKPSASATVRHRDAENGFIGLDVGSLREAFEQSVEKYPNNPCLGWRGDDGAFQWHTYKADYRPAKPKHCRRLSNTA